MRTGPEWLRAELPELQRRGVLDAASAERLLQHYAQPPATVSAASRSQILTAVLGALLVGLGVLLLVAHNWDGWSRGLRVGVSFSPLLLAQALGAWVLLRRRDDVAWTEAAAVFLLTAFAAALALVGQLYHFPADLGRYLLTLALIGLPLVYLFRASLVAALVAGAAFGWTLASPERPDPAAVLLLFATLLPHALTAPAAGFRRRLLAESLPPLAALSLLVTLFDAERLALLWVLTLLGLLWLRYPPQQARDFREPLPRYGFAGVMFAALAMSGLGVWDAPPATLATVGLSQGLLVLGFGVALLGMALAALRRGDRLAAAGALPALLFALGVVVDLRPLAVLLALLFNAYVLAMGVALIRTGLAQSRLRLAQSGVAVLALLILLRFFDSGLPFSLRGLAFILVGGGFLGASVWLRRQLRT
jgi:uncharacterized membrane protein